MNNGFFEWLGSAFGEAIRAIVDTLRFLLGGVGEAIGDFTGGLARAMGMSPSVFNIAWLILGLILLYAAFKAFIQRSIIGGIFWLVLAVLVLGGLIGG
jgi:hypothetical protein